MALIQYDVSDLSVWDETPVTGPPAPLPTRARLGHWAGELSNNEQALSFLKEEKALWDETIRDRLLGVRRRRDGHWITVPIPLGNEQRWWLQTVKERQLPPERDGEPKYRATYGRGVHLYPWTGDAGPDLVVCGGEWDQMNLSQAGLEAVTSTGGVDARGWRPEWMLQVGINRRLTVVFDRGEEQAAEALARRLKPHARSVRVVHLPDDLPAKTDVTDLAREWGHDRLRHFIAGSAT